ncbi:permease prefix domain 1-containing protein [Allonocardiopsis opalescens]|uniref:Uncharacterized protein n=1 Tax=Allonocardiopsis opalescens TaxID=1144618 RepID=A0A2T0PYT5_9ACTN|nr:permease prefix domain 1-containing protein [Allonocardiopsis opalescens]PRX96705.1 hypothetical protein CLV72_107228 [Allonocardiopsis opalescens]
MSAAPVRADPIEEHVAALAAVLHGPERDKARMLDELRDGLVDTADALVEQGLSGHAAARRAVREFGTVGQLAPSFQHELTLIQARHTARAVALTVPVLLACWYLVGMADLAQGRQLPAAAQLLAAATGGVAATAALCAAASLACTGALARRLPVWHRLPLVVAWTGTTAGIAFALSALALTTASAMSGNWQLSALAGAATLVVHARVAASARVCRECARLPAGGPVPA